MRTFSLNTCTRDYSARVVDAIKRNIGYIYFFNGANVAEAQQRIYAMAMKEEKRQYDTLDPYIKSLARYVMKNHDRDIPYAPYNEEGEVAVVFTPLLEEPEYEFDSTPECMEAMRGIYLQYPEDFMRLAEVIPTTNPDGLVHEEKDPLLCKNTELKELIFVALSEFGGPTVVSCIRKLMTEMLETKAKIANERAPRDVTVGLYSFNPDVVPHLCEEAWLLDEDGDPIGISCESLYMEDFHPTEQLPFRLAVSTMCTIWRIDYSEFLRNLEELIGVPQGVDNECIKWCGSVCKYITPAGVEMLNVDKNTYLDMCRREVITSIANTEVLRNLIAVGDYSAYIKLTKVTNLHRVILQSGKTGRRYILPATVQPVAQD